LFAGFLEDLHSVQQGLEQQTLRGIAGLSMMRYAAALAPDAFGDYFEQLPDGTYKLLRLPADSDPMMARIRRIRSVEYVMTDAIDQKFRELYEEVDSVYEIWRKYAGARQVGCRLQQRDGADHRPDGRTDCRDEWLG
jgi:hypothetical protein